MLTKKRLQLRVIATILCGTFVAQELHAAPVSAQAPDAISLQQRLLSNPNDLDVPLDFAELTELHKGSKDALIIHIQDAHSNTSGQQNLAGTLDFLMKKYGIRLVLSEGGEGDCSLTSIKKIASPKIWKRVAKTFLLNGEIQGEEYLNLTSNHPMKIVGIEDMKLYDKGLGHYTELVERREKAVAHIRKIETALEKIKNRLYPDALKEYEKTKKKDGFEKAFKKFLEIRHEANLPKEDGELAKLSAVMRLEAGLNFELANLERAVLLEELHEKEKTGDLDSLLAKEKGKFKNKTALYTHFQKTLNIARENGLDVSKFENLNAYVSYLREFAGIDMDAFLKEWERAEDELYAKTLEGDAAIVRAIDRFMTLLHSAHEIRMTTPEHDAFKASEPAFPLYAVEGFLNRKLAEQGYFDDLIGIDMTLDEARKAIDDFYDSVTERDLVFIRNVQKSLETEGQKIAFLITGGYHTPHLKKLMKEKGYGYAVLTPLVTTETNQKKYEKLLLGKDKSDTQRAMLAATPQNGARLSKLQIAAAGRIEIPAVSASSKASKAATRRGARLTTLEKMLNVRVFTRFYRSLSEQMQRMRGVRGPNAYSLREGLETRINRAKLTIELKLAALAVFPFFISQAPSGFWFGFAVIIGLLGAYLVYVQVNIMTGLNRFIRRREAKTSNEAVSQGARLASEASTESDGRPKIPLVEHIQSPIGSGLRVVFFSGISIFLLYSGLVMSSSNVFLAALFSVFLAAYAIIAIGGLYQIVTVFIRYAQHIKRIPDVSFYKKLTVLFETEGAWSEKMTGIFLSASLSAPIIFGSIIGAVGALGLLPPATPAMISIFAVFYSSVAYSLLSALSMITGLRWLKAAASAAEFVTRGVLFLAISNLAFLGSHSLLLGVLALSSAFFIFSTPFGKWLLENISVHLNVDRPLRDSKLSPADTEPVDRDQDGNRFASQIPPEFGQNYRQRVNENFFLLLEDYQNRTGIIVPKKIAFEYLRGSFYSESLFHKIIEIGRLLALPLLLASSAGIVTPSVVFGFSVLLLFMTTPQLIRSISSGGHGRGFWGSLMLIGAVGLSAALVMYAGVALDGAQEFLTLGMGSDMSTPLSMFKVGMFGIAIVQMIGIVRDFHFFWSAFIRGTRFTKSVNHYLDTRVKRFISESPGARLAEREGLLKLLLVPALAGAVVLFPIVVFLASQLKDRPPVSFPLGSPEIIYSLEGQAVPAGGDALKIGFQHDIDGDFKETISVIVTVVDANGGPITFVPGRIANNGKLRLPRGDYSGASRLFVDLPPQWEQPVAITGVWLDGIALPVDRVDLSLPPESDNKGLSELTDLEEMARSMLSIRPLYDRVRALPPGQMLPGHSIDGYEAFLNVEIASRQAPPHKVLAEALELIRRNYSPEVFGRIVENTRHLGLINGSFFDRQARGDGFVFIDAAVFGYDPHELAGALVRGAMQNINYEEGRFRSNPNGAERFDVAAMNELSVRLLGQTLYMAERPFRSEHYFAMRHMADNVFGGPIQFYYQNYDNLGYPLVNRILNIFYGVEIQEAHSGNIGAGERLEFLWATPLHELSDMNQVWEMTYGIGDRYFMLQIGPDGTPGQAVRIEKGQARERSPDGLTLRAAHELLNVMEVLEGWMVRPGSDRSDFFFIVRDTREYVRSMLESSPSRSEGRAGARLAQSPAPAGGGRQNSPERHMSRWPNKLIAVLFLVIHVSMAGSLGYWMLIANILNGYWAAALMNLIIYPIAVLMLMFPALMLVGVFFIIFSPILGLTQNSKHYSFIPEKKPAKAKWLSVTIQIPVYNEAFEADIKPTLLSAIAARNAYNLKTRAAKSNIVVNDDYLMFLEDNEIDRFDVLRALALSRRTRFDGLSADEREALARIRFYEKNNIGYTARRKEGRAGRFKKAGNLNIGMDVDEAVQQLMQERKDISYEDALKEVSRGRGPPIIASGNILIGDIIVMLDAKDRMSKNIIAATIPEFINHPDLGITQHQSRVLNAHENRFTRTVGHFTNYLYQVVFPTRARQGDLPPFVGHNAFIRKEALVNAAFIDAGRKKYWNENKVSEDFDFSMRMQSLGYITRYVAYPGMDFEEAVSESYDQEIKKFNRYAFGASELIFNPVKDWFKKGLLSHFFNQYVRSKVPLDSKIMMVAYLFSYFAILSAFIFFPIQVAVILISDLSWSAITISSIWMIGINLALFSLMGMLASLVTRAKMLQHKEFRVSQSFSDYAQDELSYQWRYNIFFTGVSFSVFRGIIAQLFDLDLKFGATAGKNGPTDQALMAVTNQIWKANRNQFIVALVSLVAIGVVWFLDPVNITWHFVMGPIVLAVGHLIAPFFYNPVFMEHFSKKDTEGPSKFTDDLLSRRNLLTAIIGASAGAAFGPGIVSKLQGTADAPGQEEFSPVASMIPHAYLKKRNEYPEDEEKRDELAIRAVIEEYRDVAAIRDAFDLVLRTRAREDLVPEAAIGLRALALVRPEHLMDIIQRFRETALERIRQGHFRYEYLIADQLLTLGSARNVPREASASAIQALKEVLIKRLESPETLRLLEEMEGEGRALDPTAKEKAFETVRRSIEHLSDMRRYRGLAAAIARRFRRTPQRILFYLTIPEVVYPLWKAHGNNAGQASRQWPDMEFFTAATFAEGYIRIAQTYVNGNAKRYLWAQRSVTQEGPGLEAFEGEVQGLREGGFLRPSYTEQAASLRSDDAEGEYRYSLKEDGERWVWTSDDGTEHYNVVEFRNSTAVLEAMGSLLASRRDRFLSAAGREVASRMDVPTKDAWTYVFFSARNPQRLFRLFGPTIVGKFNSRQHARDARYTAQLPAATAELYRELGIFRPTAGARLSATRRGVLQLLVGGAAVAGGTAARMFFSPPNESSSAPAPAALPPSGMEYYALRDQTLAKRYPQNVLLEQSVQEAWQHLLAGDRKLAAGDKQKASEEWTAAALLPEIIAEKYSDWIELALRQERKAAASPDPYPLAGRVGVREDDAEFRAAFSNYGVLYEIGTAYYVRAAALHRLVTNDVSPSENRERLNATVRAIWSSFPHAQTYDPENRWMWRIIHAEIDEWAPDALTQLERQGRRVDIKKLENHLRLSERRHSGARLAKPVAVAPQGRRMVIDYSLKSPLDTILDRTLLRDRPALLRLLNQDTGAEYTMKVTKVLQAVPRSHSHPFGTMERIIMEDGDGNTTYPEALLGEDGYEFMRIIIDDVGALSVVRSENSEEADAGAWDVNVFKKAYDELGSVRFRSSELPLVYRPFYEYDDWDNLQEMREILHRGSLDAARSYARMVHSDIKSKVPLAFEAMEKAIRRLEEDMKRPSQAAELRKYRDLLLEEKERLEKNAEHLSRALQAIFDAASFDAGPVEMFASVEEFLKPSKQKQAVRFNGQLIQDARELAPGLLSGMEGMLFQIKPGIDRDQDIDLLEITSIAASGARMADNSMDRGASNEIRRRYFKRYQKNIDGRKLLDGIAMLFGIDDPTDEERIKEAASVLGKMSGSSNAFFDGLVQDLGAISLTRYASGAHRFMPLALAVVNQIKGRSVFAREGLEELKAIDDDILGFDFMAEMNPLYSEDAKDVELPNLILKKPQGNQSSLRWLDIGSAPKREGAPTLMLLKRALSSAIPDRPFEFVGTDVAFPQYSSRDRKVLKRTPYIFDDRGMVKLNGIMYANANRPENDVTNNLFALGKVFGKFDYISIAATIHWLRKEGEPFQTMPIADRLVLRDERGENFQTQFEMTETQQAVITRLLESLNEGVVRTLIRSKPGSIDLLEKWEVLNSEQASALLDIAQSKNPNPNAVNAFLKDNSFSDRIKQMIQEYPDNKKTILLTRLIPMAEIRNLIDEKKVPENIVYRALAKRFSVIPFVDDAVAVVTQIQDKVNGPSNAWRIVIGQGHQKALSWVAEAEKVVSEIKNIVGGSSHAWQIVMNQGHENALAWVAQAEKVVREIQDRVGGPSNAWYIVIAQGREKALSWIAEAEKVVVHIQDRVLGPRNAWYIVLHQGLKKTLAWVSQAEKVVSEIQDRVGGPSNAWTIVIAQGHEKALSWIAEAEEVVTHLQDRVSGLYNAWHIVIRQGHQKAFSWVTEAEKVAVQMQVVGNDSRIWQIIIAQGHENALAWVIQAEKVVSEIQDRVGGPSNAWAIVIAQGHEKAISWVESAQKVVLLIQDKVGGANIAWMIVIVTGHEKAAAWVDHRQFQAEELQQSKGMSVKATWRQLIRASSEDTSLDSGLSGARLAGRSDREGIGYASGPLTRAESQYIGLLGPYFKKSGFSHDEIFALTSALARIKRDSLLLRGEIFPEEDTKKILDYSLFDLGTFINMINKEREKYRAMKDARTGKKIFKEGEIFWLLFRRITPQAWLEQLMFFEGLNKTQASFLARWADPLEQWKILKPIRDELVSSGLGASQAFRIVTSWSDPEQTWENVLKPLLGELIASGLSKSDAAHILTGWSDPLKTWNRVLKPIRDELIRDGLNKTEATRVVITWSDPKRTWSRVLKPLRDELMSSGLSKTEATRMVTLHSDPKNTWRKVLRPIRNELVSGGLNKARATQVVMGWSHPKEKLKAVQTSTRNLLRHTGAQAFKRVRKLLFEHSYSNLRALLSDEYSVPKKKLEQALRPMLDYEEKFGARMAETIDDERAENLWKWLHENYVFYHGTSSINVPDILAKGLRPMSDSRYFDMQDFEFYEQMFNRVFRESSPLWNIEGRKTRVYLTTEKTTAESYAKTGPEVVGMMLNRIPEVIKKGGLSEGEILRLNQIKSKYESYMQNHRPVVLEIKGSVLFRAGLGPFQNKESFKVWLNEIAATLEDPVKDEQLIKWMLEIIEQRINFSIGEVMPDEILVPAGARLASGYGRSIWYNHRDYFGGTGDMTTISIRYSQQYRYLRDYLFERLSHGMDKIRIVSIGMGDGREPASVAAYLLWLQDPSAKGRTKKDVTLGGLLKGKKIEILAYDADEERVNHAERIFSAKSRLRFYPFNEKQRVVDLLNRYLPQIKKAGWIKVEKLDLVTESQKIPWNETDIVLSNEIIHHLSDEGMSVWKHMDRDLPDESILLVSLVDFVFIGGLLKESNDRHPDMLGNFIIIDDPSYFMTSQSIEPSYILRKRSSLRNRPNQAEAGARLADTKGSFGTEVQKFANMTPERMQELLGKNGGNSRKFLELLPELARLKEKLNKAYILDAERYLDCVSYTEKAKDLFKKFGLEFVARSVFREGWINHKKPNHHVYIEVLLEDQKWAVDLTADQFGRPLNGNDYIWKYPDLGVVVIPVSEIEARPDVWWMFAGGQASYFEMRDGARLATKRGESVAISGGLAAESLRETLYYLKDQVLGIEKKLPVEFSESFHRKAAQLEREGFKYFSHGRSVILFVSEQFPDLIFKVGIKDNFYSLQEEKHRQMALLAAENGLRKNVNRFNLLKLPGLPGIAFENGVIVQEKVTTSDLAWRHPTKTRVLRAELDRKLASMKAVYVDPQPFNDGFVNGEFVVSDLDAVVYRPDFDTDNPLVLSDEDVVRERLRKAFSAEEQGGSSRPEGTLDTRVLNDPSSIRTEDLETMAAIINGSGARFASMSSFMIATKEGNVLAVPVGSSMVAFDVPAGERSGARLSVIDLAERAQHIKEEGLLIADDGMPQLESPFESQEYADLIIAGRAVLRRTGKAGVALIRSIDPAIESASMALIRENRASLFGLGAYFRIYNIHTRELIPELSDELPKGVDEEQGVLLGDPSQLSHLQPAQKFVSVQALDVHDNEAEFLPLAAAFQAGMIVGRVDTISSNGPAQQFFSRLTGVNFGEDEYQMWVKPAIYISRTADYIRISIKRISRVSIDKIFEFTKMALQLGSAA